VQCWRILRSTSPQPMVPGHLKNDKCAIKIKSGRNTGENRCSICFSNWLLACKRYMCHGGFHACCLKLTFVLKSIQKQFLTRSYYGCCLHSIFKVQCSVQRRTFIRVRITKDGFPMEAIYSNYGNF
jgi:hypothetical protein